jgi:acyl dehydratase
MIADAATHLRELVGADLPASRWLTVDQERIDTFAACTEDRQSIHVDHEQAAASPFGQTVAHGFLTLALVIPLWNEVVPLEGAVTVNYGVNRVRFPAPVPAGSRIRGRFQVLAVDEVAGGVQATVGATIEREGAEKPVCVAELLLRVLT